MTADHAQCEVCHHDESAIVERRGNRRRRECRRCHHRWTTYEVPAERLERLEAIEQHAAALAEAMNQDDG